MAAEPGQGLADVGSGPADTPAPCVLQHRSHAGPPPSQQTLWARGPSDVTTWHPTSIPTAVGGASLPPQGPQGGDRAQQPPLLSGPEIAKRPLSAPLLGRLGSNGCFQVEHPDSVPKGREVLTGGKVYPEPQDRKSRCFKSGLVPEAPRLPPAPATSNLTLENSASAPSTAHTQSPDPPRWPVTQSLLCSRLPSPNIPTTEFALQHPDLHPQGQMLFSGDPAPSHPQSCQPKARLPWKWLPVGTEQARAPRSPPSPVGCCTAPKVLGDPAGPQDAHYTPERETPPGTAHSLSSPGGIFSSPEACTQRGRRAWLRAGAAKAPGGTLRSHPATRRPWVSRTD